MSRGEKNHFLLTPGFKNTLATEKQIVCQKMFTDHVISKEKEKDGLTELLIFEE